MKSIILNNNIKMPALGFGTWKLQGEECERAVRLALEVGYRHLDTAQIYENEHEVGQAIRQSGIARTDMFITMKLWVDNFGRSAARPALEASLKKLQLDYVDLLLLHWPTKEMELGFLLDTLQEFMAQGKTKAIGVSNFPVALLREAIETHKAPIANNQIEYHVMLGQDKILNYARTHNMSVTAYSPLGRGRMTDEAVLQHIADKHNKTPGQVALRWLVQQDGVAAIPKAASEAHIRANIDIFNFELDVMDLQAIAAMDKTRRGTSPEWGPVWDN